MQKKAELGNVFTIASKNAPMIQEAYDKAMKKLGNFFGIEYVHDRPKVFLVANKKTIRDLREGRVASWVQGWVDGKTSTVFILDRKRRLSKREIEGLYSGLLHELAHLFFLKVSGTNDDPLPVWLWEGTSLFLDGHTEQGKWNSVTPPKRFEDFLGYYSVHKLPGKEHEEGVYKESGFVVDLLATKFGKGKLLRLIRSLGRIRARSEFYREFKKVYGFELNYANFNRINSE